MTPEAKARRTIDALLAQAGWHVCGMADFNIHAARGVAIREFPLNTGFGFADYLLYVDGKACGVIEARKQDALAIRTALANNKRGSGEADRESAFTPLWLLHRARLIWPMLINSEARSRNFEVSA